MASGASARGWMVPVYALLVVSVTVFTAQNIVAGLLPQLAADLKVDIPTAGLLMTAYALSMAVATPVIALMAGGVPRKTLLMVSISIFVIGNVLSAVATDYWTLMAARLAVATFGGLIFGLATVVATRLAPADRKTSAVSLVVAGATVAAIIGLPLGTAIGNAWGWRAAIWTIAAAGAVAGLIMLLLIPSAVQQEKKTSVGAELVAATRPLVLLWYAVFAAYRMGVFALFTYIVPLLTDVSGVPIELVPWVFAGIGVTGFAGNLIGGRLGDKRPVATIIGIVIGVGLAYLVMTPVAANAWAICAAFWVAWLIGFGLPAPLRAQIIKHAGAAPTLASMLTTSAGNLGSAAGAALGGVAIAAGWSYGQLPLLGAVCFGLTLILVLLIAVLERRAPRVATP